MAYIGKTPTVGNFQVCDAISVVNGQAAYTMQINSTNVEPESANHMLVSLNGILQKPGSSFTISSSTMTFASNLATGDVIDFVQILGNVLDLGQPSDDTVTAAKLNNDVISGQTALTAEPADTDEFLVSDAGTIKRIDYSLIKGSGKLLQVVYAVTTTETSSTSASYVDILSLNITPSATSSKVLVLASIGGLIRFSGDTELQLRVLRGSTSIGQIKTLNDGTSNLIQDSGTINELDEPSTTSATTYKIQIQNRDGNGTVRACHNNADTSLTLMEIAG